MAFRFEWDDTAQTAIRYIAEGQWNWRDYHVAVRVSQFSMTHIDHPVDSIVDFRGSGRARFPAGLLGHARSMGKRHIPQFSGWAVVVGVPADAEAQLPLGPDRTLSTPDGGVRFVDTEDEVQAILRAWREQRANHGHD